MTTVDPANPVFDTVRHLIKASRPPRVRTIREFAEQEIIIPTGNHAGERFRCETQPLTRLWFEAFDSGHWSRHVATGPQQSGKTLAFFTIPIIYYLFEWREAVILGAPDMPIIRDKWRRDLLPAILASRYARYLPERGSGSKGGQFREAVTFTNNAELRAMTAAGDDESRSHYNARIAVMTEADDMADGASTSLQSDPITQIEGRTRVYSDLKRIFLEGTLTVEEGRLWNEYTNGTASRVMSPCPHCCMYIRPEREHFHGWQDAADVIAAREKARFHCPECGKPITEEKRCRSMQKCVLAHKGQRVHRNGRVVGKPPRTNTLGFRYSVWDNLLVPAADAAEAEWKSQRSSDHESAERALCQYVWAIPHASESETTTELRVDDIQRRITAPRRGIIPSGATSTGLGVDIGKRIAHWALLALWPDEETAHVADYGVAEIRADEIGDERACEIALADLYDDLMQGFAHEDEDDLAPPDLWLIDSGYQLTRDVVYEFSRTRANVLPSKGAGETQYQGKAYRRPMKRGKHVRFIGDQYHIALIAPNRRGRPYMPLVHDDVDYWKMRVHAGLRVPIPHEDDHGRPRVIRAGDVPGAITIYSADPRRHLTFAKHLTSEREREEFVPGRGIVRVFEQMSKRNHWLDAVRMALLAARMVEDRAVRSGRDDRQPASIDAEEWYQA